MSSESHPMWEGAHLSIPVCDLRPFSYPDSRYGFLSSISRINVGPKKRSFLNGLGYARERAAIRIPWRARTKETVYFDCSSALSVPVEKLARESVAKVVRRVYVDGRALVRFEVSCFISPHRVRFQPGTKLRDNARDIWNKGLLIGLPRRRAHSSYPAAFDLLLRRFVQSTTPRILRSDPHTLDLCTWCSPQLQIVAMGDKATHPKGSVQLDPDGIYGACRALHLSGQSQPIDTIYFVCRPGFFADTRDDTFNQFRAIRNEITWFHADVEMLKCLLALEYKSLPESQAAITYVLEIVEGLRSVLTSTANPIGALVRAPGALYTDRLMRMLDGGIAESKLPDSIRESLRSLGDVVVAGEAQQ